MLQEGAAGDEAGGALHAVGMVPILGIGRQPEHGWEHPGPEQDEGGQDALQPVAEEALPSAFPEERPEEAGHDEEHRHPEGVDQRQGPVVEGGGMSVFVRPTAIAGVADNSMKPDSEQHHGGSQAVQCVVAFHGSTLARKLNGSK